MADLNNRKKYTSLDEETLEGIADEDLDQAILDFVDSKIGGDYGREYEIVTSLSLGFQAIYTTWRAQAEITNGGFHQYFWNSTGQFAIEAIDGFYEIGALQAAELMDRAVAIAIEELPTMRQTRMKVKGILEAYAESARRSKLNDLNREFWEIDGDLSALRIKYIRAHPELFVGD